MYGVKLAVALIVAPEFYTTMDRLAGEYAARTGSLLYDETVSALTRKRWHGKPRWYDRKRASAPGETPRSETGQLVNSLVLRGNRYGYVAQVQLLAPRAAKGGTGLLWSLLERGGKRAYIIRPVRAKRLAFHQWDPVANDFVFRFAKQVRHPPLAPRPFRELVLDRVVREMTKRRRKST